MSVNVFASSIVMTARRQPPGRTAGCSTPPSRGRAPSGRTAPAWSRLDRGRLRNRPHPAPSAADLGVRLVNDTRKERWRPRPHAHVPSMCTCTSHHSLPGIQPESEPTIKPRGPGVTVTGTAEPSRASSRSTTTHRSFRDPAGTRTSGPPIHSAARHEVSRRAAPARDRPGSSAAPAKLRRSAPRRPPPPPPGRAPPGRSRDRCAIRRSGG